jgi:subtilisin family serine protease
MATPHVAGIVALMASHFPGITNQQIVDRIMRTVVKSPAYEGKTISGGRINAAAALSGSLAETKGQ